MVIRLSYRLLRHVLPAFIFVHGCLFALTAQEFIQEKKSTQWMFVSAKGKVDKSILYDSVKTFVYGWAPVKYKGRWGCINAGNKWGIDPTYDDLDILPGELARVKSGELYGIVNFKGAIVLLPQYEAIDHYIDGYGTVKTEGTWYALTPEGLQQEDIIFHSPDQKAYLPGCEPGDYTCCTEKMAMSIFQDIRYPALARENGIQGAVIMSAIIDTQGQMTRHTLHRGIYPACDEEAMRVFRRMDFQWIPARHEGRVVPQRIFFPIKFTLGR